jgi:GT2 family glycosyltransferase
MSAPVEKHRDGPAAPLPHAMPEVTLCVLTYGDHPRLARRVIDSIRRYCPRSAYQLVVGANAVSDQTLAHLEALKSDGEVDHLIASPANLNKCPMMRRMFDTVETDFIWWFDDDSHVTSPDAFARWMRTARTAPATTVMWGQLYRCGAPEDFTDLADVLAFVRAASWYRGLPPPSWRIGGKGECNFMNRNCGDGRWDFIVGGCWLVRTSAIRALDWPDRRLVKLGDDVLLGEAIRQQCWELGNIGNPGISINTESRRGDAGSCRPAAPLIHD